MLFKFPTAVFKYMLACLILLAGSFSAKASDAYLLNSYTVEDGLSHNTVWCALQDSYGFIWFGTSNGLNCFDGRNNVVYRVSSQGDANSLGNNFVHSLFEDKEGRIWVGTNCGIYIYDRTRDAFSFFDCKTEFDVSISSEVSRIVLLSDGLIAIATLGQGLFFYHTETQTLVQDNIRSSFVWDICVGEDKGFCISSLRNDVLCFDRQGEYQKTYQVPSLGDARSSFDRINCLQLMDGNLWLGTDGRYLFEIDTESGMVSHHEIDTDRFRAVRCLMPWKEGCLLAGTDNGLYSFDCRKGIWSPVYSSAGQGFGNKGSINALMKDVEGGIWALTNMQGVKYLSTRIKPFERYQTQGGVVNAFCEDRQRKVVWLGMANGLYQYDLQSKEMKEYPMGGKDGQKYDIRTLYLQNDELWIGTSANGLIVLECNTGRMRHYNHSYTVPNTICSDDVQKIYICRNGRVYVGTSWGLCFYNPEEDDFHTEITIGVMISITDILEDGHGNVWIATANNGVFLYRQTQNVWKHYTHSGQDRHSISSNSIMTLFEDKNGVVWFGTNGNGLCYFDEGKNCFVDFGRHNQWLSSQVVYAVEQDYAGMFWMSTNAGIVKLDPKVADAYQRYTESDGLQSNQFSARASLKDADGIIYFGGINGFNAFLPSSFPSNSYVPPVYITDISLMRIDNKKEMHELLQLDKPLYLAEKVEIPYAYNSFTVYFSALSYQDPRKNHYSYKLEGVDKEWFDDLENNSVSYHNLSPGKYRLLVRGSNNDLKWNEKTAELWIVITPPWWLSPWAYAFYALVVVCVLAYLLWRRDRHIKNKYRKRMEIYQVEKEKELYRSKINFFINLVHEIRTPLSLIKLPLETLKEGRTNAGEDKYLSVIDKNVDYLLGVTNELLDFQKMESGVVQLHLKKQDIVRLLHDIYNQFVGLAELKHITLTLVIPEQFRLEAVVDVDKVSKIIVNLVSNAMKYARRRIDVRIKKQDDATFCIVVDDDGPGIPFKEKEKVFQAFYQLADSKASLGTGLGLAYSRSLAENCHGSLNVDSGAYGGAAFILMLPVCCQEEKEETTDLLPDSEEQTVPQSAAEEDDPLLQQKYTVLIVEDNLDLLEMECVRLAGWFKVLKAGNGVQALKVLETNAVDVVVSDVMMPKMDGLELCRRIKDNIEFSHIPVILLTAKTLPEAKAEGLSCGADAYVEKPFTVVQLKMQIRNILRLRLRFHQRVQELNQECMAEVQGEVSITPRDREFLSKMQQVIDMQLSDENFSIDSLAADMNMSRSNFYRKLKALTGMSPNDYLKFCRLNKAAALLKEGVRVNEVCAQTGFGSSSYFAKCFKAHFGVLPKDYVTHFSS